MIKLRAPFFKSRMLYFILGWIFVNILISIIGFCCLPDEIQKEMLASLNLPLFYGLWFNRIIAIKLPIFLIIGLISAWVVYFVQPWIIVHQKINLGRNYADSWPERLGPAFLALIISAAIWLFLCWYNIDNTNLSWLTRFLVQINCGWLTGFLLYIIFAPLLLMAIWKVLVFCARFLVPEIMRDFAKRISEANSMMEELDKKKIVQENEVQRLKQRYEAKLAELDRKNARFGKEAMVLLNRKKALDSREAGLDRKEKDCQALVRSRMADIDQQSRKLEEDYQDRLSYLEQQEKRRQDDYQSRLADLEQRKQDHQYSVQRLEEDYYAKVADLQCWEKDYQGRIARLAKQEKAFATKLEMFDRSYQSSFFPQGGKNLEEINQKRERLMEQAQREAQEIKDQAQAEADDLERRRQEIQAWEAELAEAQAALEQSRIQVGRYRVQAEQEIQAARDQAREIIEQAQKDAQGIKEEIQAQEDKLKRNLDQLKDFFVWANFRAQDKHISKEFWQEVIEAREAVFAEAQKKAVELMVQGEVSDESIKKRILENQALAVSDYKLLTEEDLAMIKVLVRPEIDRIIAQARAEVVRGKESAAVTVQAPAVPADAGDTGPGRADDTGNQKQDADIPQVEGEGQEFQEIEATGAKVIRLFHSQQVVPQEVVPEGSDEQENPPSMVDEARETLASDEQQRDQSDPGSISDHDKQDQNILGQETNVATPKKEIEYQEQTVGSQEECNEELEPCDDQQQWEAFLSACKEIFGDRAFLTQDLLDAMENHDVLKDILPNSLKAKSLKGFGKVLGNQVGMRYGDRGLYLVRVAKIGPNKDLKGWQIGHKDNQL